MIKKYQKSFVLSLGGSLIFPNGGIDIPYLKEFNKFIRKKVSAGMRFFIVTGAGSPARKYMDTARAVLGEKVSQEEYNWLGIHASRINSHLVRTIFREITHPRIIHNYERLDEKFREPLVIAGGWKPGFSTDYCAVLLARKYHHDLVINLTDINRVYTKDPRKFSDAKPIEKITWEELLKITGKKFTPGMSAPFDPIASQLAKKIGLTVIVCNGRNLKNLGNCLSGKKFKGTVITPFSLDAGFYDREYFEGEKGELIPTTSFKGRIYSFLSSLYRALCLRLFLRPKTVLDVGCGLGKMVYFLRLLGVEAYGVEISQYALKETHPIIKRYLKYGNILKLPYKDKSFDLVTTFDVLEHIETESLKKAVFECNRVAKRFSLHKIFTHENWWMKQFHGPDLSHVSVYDQKWWKKFFKKLGFKRLERFYSYLPHFIETLFLLEKKEKR